MAVPAVRAPTPPVQAQPPSRTRPAPAGVTAPTSTLTAPQAGCSPARSVPASAPLSSPPAGGPWSGPTNTAAVLSYSPGEYKGKNSPKSLSVPLQGDGCLPLPHCPPHRSRHTVLLYL